MEGTTKIAFEKYPKFKKINKNKKFVHIIDPNQKTRQQKVSKRKRSIV